MEIKPVKKKRQYEEVADQLKELIRSGELAPDIPLPSERELAKKFQVGRYSIRQALTTLEMAGLIERRRGEGTYSKDKLSYYVAQMANSIMEIQKDVIYQPMEARKAIEPSLANLAAKRATSEDIAEIEKALKNHENAVVKNEKITVADNEFHVTIGKAARNEILLKALETINKLSWESRDISAEPEESPRISLEQHKKIYEAIKNGDEKKAHKNMVDHLNTVEKLIYSTFEEDKN